jgi:precorrin-6Y C5,15-methyltransferase (decarboxylating)
VLADGDPLFFGIGATLAKILSPEALRILPGLSSLQEACARACLPWHDVRCVSLHGRGDHTKLAIAVLSGTPICLLTGAANTPDAIARFLLDRGVDWYSMHVFENMHQERESSRVYNLPEAAHLDFGPVCTVLLISGASPRSPYLGIPDAQLAGDGLFTKSPVRAAALADLRIRPDDLVWDLGAGSGAMALEACALAHRSLVFAVEQNVARIPHIEENRRHFGAANLEIVAGNAPGCLPSLPDPDALFIGGGLGKPEGFQPLLSAACSRLKPGGRLAIRCMLMGSLERCRAFIQSLGWATRIRCIQISETNPPGNDQRLAALNPVFLISAVKPAETDG